MPTRRPQLGYSPVDDAGHALVCATSRRPTLHCYNGSFKLASSLNGAFSASSHTAHELSILRYLYSPYCQSSPCQPPCQPSTTSSSPAYCSSTVYAKHHPCKIVAELRSLLLRRAGEAEAGDVDKKRPSSENRYTRFHAGTLAASLDLVITGSHG